MKKTKLLCLLLALILTLSVLVGCVDEDSDTDTDNNTSSGDTWTVMLYLCGTDLESEGGAATANLEELLSVDFTENITYVIQTGGTSEWWTDGISSENLQRYVVEDGSLTLVEELDLASMADPDTLSSFLKWGIENYPADKYMINFWDHGGGSVGGVECDELYENNALSLTDVSSAVASTETQFELIGFDTCLMATLENAVLLSDYANYMVASEEYEPGGGWDYTSWLTYLNENPECNGKELGIAICDSYFAKCTNDGNGDMATLSVIDLSAIGGLYDSFKKMSSEMTSVSEDVTQLQSFIRGSIKAESYGGNTEEEGYTNMVDLGDLVANTQDVGLDSANDVLAGITSAVVYQVKGESRSCANGISVFFPLTLDTEMLDIYAKVTDNAAYLKFIDNLTDDWSAPDWVYETEEKTENAVSKNDYTVELATEITEDGEFVLGITSGLEVAEEVVFSLYLYDGENGEYICLGSDNDLTGDWETGIFQDNFRGVWMTLGGCFCAPQLIASEDGYNLYSVPVMLNGEQTNLRVIYDFEAEQYVTLGAYDGLGDSGMSSRDIKKLKDGDTLAFMFDIVDINSGESQTYTMSEITYTEGMEFVESELIDGDYLYMYQVTDIFGGVTESDVAVMTCENGEIYVSQS